MVHNDKRHRLGLCVGPQRRRFALAAIRWRPGVPEARYTLNGYHDRAPVVLFGKDWGRWLDVEADVTDLLGPESADRFTVAKTFI